MDFNPSRKRRSTTPSGSRSKPARTLTVDLQWAEPWNGVSTDLDALPARRRTAKSIAAEGSESQHRRQRRRTQRPFELLQWENNRPRTGSPACVDQPLPRRANPRLKFVLLENGRGVSEPSTRNRAKATWSARPSSATPAPRARSPSGRFRYNDAVAARGILLARPGHPLLRPGRRARPRGAARLARDDRQARPRRDRLRRDDLLRSPGQSRRLALLRDLGGGAARRRGRGADAPGQPVAAPAQVRAALTATATRSPPSARRGRRRAGRRLRRGGSAGPAAGDHDHRGAAALGRNRTPTIEFAANRPVAFSCAGRRRPAAAVLLALQGPEPLADGSTASRSAASTSPAAPARSRVASFTIDTAAAHDVLRQAPAAGCIRTRHRKVAGDLPLRLQRGRRRPSSARSTAGLLRFCGAQLSRRFDAGKHIVTGQSPRRGRQRRPHAGRLPLPGQAGRLTASGRRAPPPGCGARSSGRRTAARAARRRCR